MRVPAADVESLVVEHLASAMENREELRAAFEELRREPARARGQWEQHLVALGAEKQRLERQRDGVYAMREAGETTAAQFVERRAAVEAALAAVRAELAEVQQYLGQVRDQEALWTSLEAFCEEMAGRLRESEAPECFERRQRTVQALVDAVDVYPDRFLVSGVFGGVIYPTGLSRPS
jgi:chromosome segregation ATPase